MKNRVMYAVAVWSLVGLFVLNSRTHGEELDPCQRALDSVPVGEITEDPFAPEEIQIAREAARAIQPYLSAWTFKLEDLDAEKVNASLAQMTAHNLDIHGAGFRNLFLATQRFLLGSKGVEGRLRPMADSLGISEGETRLIVHFIGQLDALAAKGKVDSTWPRFLILSAKPNEFIRQELGEIPGIVQKYLEKNLSQVLGDRLRYTRLSINRLANQVTLRSPVGIYKLNLYRTQVVRRAIAPLTVRSSEAWQRQHDSIVYSMVDVSLIDEEAKSYLRTLFRADAFLHPHLIPPSLEIHPQPARPSEIQIEALERLLKVDQSLRAGQRQGPLELGLIMPTGEGKTVVAAEFLKELRSTVWVGRWPKIILVVENVQILQQTVESFVRDLGLPANKVAMLFGDPGVVTIKAGPREFNVPRGSAQSPPADFDLVVITRSTFFQRQSSIQFWISHEQDRPSGRRPFAVIVDEAHHIGTESGEYEEILTRLRGWLGVEDRVLYMSATLWHEDQEIVRDVLKGAVTATHLLEDELRLLREGRDLERLARTQFLRAAIDGYVGPIEDQSFTLVTDTESRRSIQRSLTPRRATDEYLYKVVGDLIKRIRQPGTMDRYLFFEATQERAETGADLLQNLLGSGPTASDVNRAAWFMHSSLPIQEQSDRMAWFRDRGPHRGSRFRHKYLETVGQAVEGVDIRGINGLVVMRNLSNIRLAQQVIGRGARLEPFKTGVRLIDVPGRIIGYFKEDQQLWTRASSPGPVIFDWHSVPKQSLWDQPDQLAKPNVDGVPMSDITPERLNLEPVLDRERQRIKAWRDEIRAVDLERLVSEAGAHALLSLDPDSGIRQSHVRMRDWFRRMRDRFPTEIRRRWDAQWSSLDITNSEIDLPLKGQRELRQAGQGFQLLAKMFNGLERSARKGFRELADEEVLSLPGQARVTAYLNPKINFLNFDGLPVHRGSLIALAKLSSSELKILSDGLLEGHLLRGPKPAKFHEAINGGRVRPARELFVAAARLIHLRPALQTPGVLAVLETGLRYMEGVQESDGHVHSLATYYLGMLVNQLIADADLKNQKPWNLNGYYGLANGADVVEGEYITRPSQLDLWSLLDLAEYRLMSVRQ